MTGDDLTCSAEAASATTTTGSPDPAGKCSDWIFSPTAICGVPVNWSLLDSPSALSPSIPIAMAPRTSVVPIHTIRGRRETAVPTRVQMPSLAASADPYDGFTGQKIQRPQMTSRAGIRVTMASSPTRMPTAQAGPSPWVELRVASISSIRLTATVAALAMIAGLERYRASAIASCRSSCRSNSSRYREMSRSA